MRDREKVISELKAAVAQERECTLRVLHLLREADTRQFYLEMGYPSLFEFVTKELGYSAGAGHRRIQSMRLLKNLPELEPRIEDGSLSLCVAAKTQSFFRKEDQKRRQEGEARLSTETKREIAQSMLGASSRDCERMLMAISPESATPSEKVGAAGDGKTVVQFVAGPELMEKLERLKGLFAHRNFEGRMDHLIELLADLALMKHDPERRAGERVVTEAEVTEPEIQCCDTTVRAPDTAAAPFPALEMKASGRTRYIPAALKRAVWARDRGRCTFTDSATGRTCESQHALEFDHRVPFAWGGETSERNLRLRCRAHNAYTARKLGLLSKRDRSVG